MDFPVTQPFAWSNPMEPAGWLYADDSIYYPGPTNGHWHNGIDYGCPQGTIIRTPAAGRVSFAGWDTTGFGNLVKVNVGDQTLWFGHLSMIAVQFGQLLIAGQEIGRSGSTGNSTGPHLHGSVTNNSTQHFVNPNNYGNRLLPLFNDDPLPIIPSPPSLGYPHLTSAQWLKTAPSDESRAVPNGRIPAGNKIAVFAPPVHNAEGTWQHIGWGHLGIFYQGYVRNRYVAFS